MRKKKKTGGGSEGGGGDWMTTYSDMVTLLLCFFAIMFNPDEITEEQMEMIRGSMNNIGIGALFGGNTLTPGLLAELGSNFNAEPARDKGQAMGDDRQRAANFFAAEIRANKIRVSSDERGLVISLVSDAFFGPASDRINIDATRDILLRLAVFLDTQDVRDRKLRIEGHTDSAPTDPNGYWPSNWHLSAARSISVLSYLTDLGVQEKRFQVAGLADTVPVARNDTAEGRAYNRRVDIIVLDDGHL
jgi:chemotaxis protein MotB